MTYEQGLKKPYIPVIRHVVLSWHAPGCHMTE